MATTQSVFGAPFHTQPASGLPPAITRPEAYPHPVEKIEVIETHISWVILTGPYAYKIKKPVRLDFVDFSTFAARLHFCREELRLNRRLARSLYLDVVEIRAVGDGLRMGGESGEIVEHALRMRQFAQDSLASRMLARNALTDDLVAALARRIAGFHSSLKADTAKPFGTPEAVLHNAVQNFEELAAFLGDEDDRARLQTVRAWTEREFIQHRDDMEARRLAGAVRECHGDLHLNNIVLLDGELVPFDCLEFNEALRWNDVMSETAFLVMDLLDRGAPGLAWVFLNAYLEATGGYSGLKVLRFYLVYRAMVRAKVHLIRARQARDAPEQARLSAAYRGYVALAERCTRLGSPAILLMRGLAGSGKSTVALDVAKALGGIRIRSDVERKRLQGLGPLERTASAVGGGPYGADATRLTYQHLEYIAGAVAAAGFTAIADATFLRRWQRKQFHEVAKAIDVPVAVLDVRTPESVLRQRIEARAAHAKDPSEANLDVLEFQKATEQPVAAAEHLPVITVDGAAGVTPSLIDRISRIVSAPAAHGRTA